MSNIIKNLQVIKSSDFELINRINSEYNRAYEAEYPNRMRSQRNWGAYSALDARAWETRDKTT